MSSWSERNSLAAVSARSILRLRSRRFTLGVFMGVGFPIADICAVLAGLLCSALSPSSLYLPPLSAILVVVGVPENCWVLGTKVLLHDYLCLGCTTTWYLHPLLSLYTCRDRVRDCVEC